MRGREGDVGDWLAECSRDPRVAWLAWRERARVCAWRAGVRVPERICRARGDGAFARWIDGASRFELVAGAASGHALPPRDLARWGQVAAATCAPATDANAARSTDPEFVLHDLAQLLAHAELELDSEDDGRARASAALRDARALLDAARTTRDVGARVATSVDLRATLEREARRAAASVPDCGVALRVRVPQTAECSLHAPAFERIARNLVVNALQASPRGATVSVSVEIAGEFLELVVCDEGRGLDERAAARLFTAGAVRPRGRGLGARSVRACVRELDGKLTVRSQPARGTEVRVRLPRHALHADVQLIDPLAPRRRERQRALGAPARGDIPPETGSGGRDPRDWQLTAGTRLVLARGCPASGLGAALELARERGEPVHVHVFGWDERVSAPA